MARTRQFDERDALDRAQAVFWAKGYAASSVEELEAATGLSRGSLYKAFGSKRGLYLKSLRKYLASGRQGLARRLHGSSAVGPALVRWLESMVELGARRQQGCFAVNSTVELGPHDPEIAEILREHRDLQRELVAAALERGLAQGELRFSESPEAVADLLVTLVAGIQAAGRGEHDRSRALTTVKTMVALLNITEPYGS